MQFPRDLGKYFINLEVLRITSCDLKTINKNQLTDLHKLKYLDLLGNRIEKLESNTFEYTINLIEVMLNNNKIKFIGIDLLVPLRKLKNVNFGGNICISSQARGSEEILQLRDEIKLKCSDISMYDLLLKMDILENRIENIAQIFRKIKEKLN